MTKPIQTKFHGWQSLVALLCALLLAPGDMMLYASPAQPQDASSGQAAPTIPNDQLDSLVAPIALYPDPLLSQVWWLQPIRWKSSSCSNGSGKNGTLKGDALTKAVQKAELGSQHSGHGGASGCGQTLGGRHQWTTDLGNAFLAQQSDVMDAVQRMRMKAKNAGNLKSSEQMKVETKRVKTKTVVVIEQTNPQVVYVPTYSPVVVYGPPVYPYPPIYLSSAKLLRGGRCLRVWSRHCHRGGLRRRLGLRLRMGLRHNNININVNNNYVSHYNRTNINNVNRNNIGNVGTTTGSTIPSTAAALLIQTRRRRISTAVQLAGIPCPHDKRMRGSNSERQSDSRPAQTTGAGIQQTGWPIRQTPARDREQCEREPRAAEAGTTLATVRFRQQSLEEHGAFGGASSKASAQASSSRGASSRRSARWRCTFGGGGQAVIKP